MTSPLHILIIDDDEVDRMAVRRSLGKARINVETEMAESITEAREKIGKIPYDCVFLDYRMPGGNGVELLREFRAAGYQMPVIVVTSHTDPALAVEVMKAGGSDFISKNVLTPELIGQVLRSAIRTHQAEAERRRAEVALRYSQARLAEAQKIAQLGHWEINLVTDMLYCSDQVFSILGYGNEDRPEQAGFKFILNHLHPSSLSKWEKAFNTCINNQQPNELDLKVVRQDGEVRHLEVHLRPIEGLEKVARIRGTIQDISFRKQIEAELIQAKDEAVRSARAKEEFLANMSHEIRTPMNAILGFTKLLQETELTEVQTEYLEAIDISGEALLAIINDILDLSKIEAGKLHFEKRTFSLTGILRSIRQIFQVKFDEKSMPLHTSIGPGVPDSISGDPVRLNQVLINLVGNALKFTEEGEIGIEIKLVGEAGREGGEGEAGGERTRKKTENVRLLFEVNDTGIGIPYDKQVDIFQSFTQASGETTRKYGGTGLGLTICKRIIELQGGKIGLQSEPGEGSNFFFELDFDLGNVETIPAPKAGESSDSGVRSAENGNSSELGVRSAEEAPSSIPLIDLKVLVAEDNRMNQLLVTKILEGMGLSFSLTESGLEALEKLQQEHFDLVLMDIQMPVMDGYEATRQIRSLSDPKRSSIPIIAMTAHAFAEERNRCLQAGMDDCISKPFKPEELRQKLSLVAKGDWSPVPPPPPTSTYQYINLAEFEELVAGKASFKRELIELFLEEAPKALAKMQKAIDEEEAEALRRAIHAFKPSVILFQIAEGPELIQEMNDHAVGERPLEAQPLHANLSQNIQLALEELQTELERME